MALLQMHVKVRIDVRSWKNDPGPSAFITIGAPLSTTIGISARGNLHKEFVPVGPKN